MKCLVVNEMASQGINLRSLRFKSKHKQYVVGDFLSPLVCLAWWVDFLAICAGVLMRGSIRTISFRDKSCAILLDPCTGDSLN